MMERTSDWAQRVARGSLNVPFLFQNWLICARYCKRRIEQKGTKISHVIQLDTGNTKMHLVICERVCNAKEVTLHGFITVTHIISYVLPKLCSSEQPSGTHPVTVCCTSVRYDNSQVCQRPSTVPLGCPDQGYWFEPTHVDEYSLTLTGYQLVARLSKGNCENALIL